MQGGASALSIARTGGGDKIPLHSLRRAARCAVPQGADGLACRARSAAREPAAPPRRGPETALAGRSGGVRVIAWSAAVVQLELHRMRGHAKARDLLELQSHVGVDHVVGEHAPAGEELAIPVEVLE